MTAADRAHEALVPIQGQSFSSEQDWINRATRCLTAHPEYHNTEHDGPARGWRGPHFTTMCFNQDGSRVRNGGDFARAEKDGLFPVWWIWPDQIAPLAQQNADLLAENERLSAQLSEAREKALREAAGIASKPLGEESPIPPDCVKYINAVRREIHALIDTPSTPAAPQTVKVKPLEWREILGVIRADTPFGRYTYIECQKACLLDMGVIPLGNTKPCETPEDAKIAAQTHYETRILSAIETTPVTPAEAARVLVDAEAHFDDQYTFALVDAIRSAAEGAWEPSIGGACRILEAALRAIAGGE